MLFITSLMIFTLSILLPKQLIAFCVCACAHVCVCTHTCVCMRTCVRGCVHACVFLSTGGVLQMALHGVYPTYCMGYIQHIAWGISNILHGVYLTYCSSHRHEWAVTGNGYGRSYTNRLTYLISHLSY